MEHVVFFPSPDGTPAFRRVTALEDAVRLVEQLRNVEGVQEVSVHALGGEVPLAFRTWYHVEVPASDAVVATDDAATLDARTDDASPDQPSSVEAAVPTPALVEAPIAVLPDQPPAEAGGDGDVPVPALVGDGSENGHVQDDAKTLGFFA